MKSNCNQRRPASSCRDSHVVQGPGLDRSSGRLPSQRDVLCLRVATGCSSDDACRGTGQNYSSNRSPKLHRTWVLPLTPSRSRLGEQAYQQIVASWNKINSWSRDDLLREPTVLRSSRRSRYPGQVKECLKPMYSFNPPSLQNPLTFANPALRARLKAYEQNAVLNAILDSDRAVCSLVKLRAEENSDLPQIRHSHLIP